MLKLKDGIIVNLGTVSHGTMRNEDLMSTFEQEIKRLTIPESFQKIRNERKLWKKSGKFWKSDYVNFLFDKLDELAPEDCYFGATEGDGSDYGFWKIADEDYCYINNRREKSLQQINNRRLKWE